MAISQVSVIDTPLKYVHLSKQKNVFFRHNCASHKSKFMIYAPTRKKKCATSGKIKYLSKQAHNRACYGR